MSAQYLDSTKLYGTNLAKPAEKRPKARIFPIRSRVSLVDKRFITQTCENNLEKLLRSQTGKTSKTSGAQATVYTKKTEARDLGERGFF